MPFVSAPLLEEATSQLSGKHPLAVLVVPAMVKNGVRVVTDPSEGTPYGSTQEVALLQSDFALPGGPRDRPFRAIWQTDPKKFWLNRRYAGRALQRERTDRFKKGS